MNKEKALGRSFLEPGLNAPQKNGSETHHVWISGVANQSWEVVGIVGLLVGPRLSVGGVLIAEQEARRVVTVKAAVEVEVGDIESAAGPSDRHRITVGATSARHVSV